MILQIESVSKRFGALQAVSEVSFSVSAGQIFGVAGPNGSGKSTLFNLISGIPFGPDAGTVRFDGRPVQGMLAHRIARAGLVRSFQRETDFPTLSVLDNVRMGASLGGTRQTSEAQLHQALERVELPQALFHRPAASLAVFDRKRLMLASALAMEPQVLLLDEPASGLTQPEIRASTALIRRIADEGVAVLLVEHVLGMLLALSSQLLILNQGRMLALGEPREVVANPAVVAAYLGQAGARHG